MPPLAVGTPFCPTSRPIFHPQFSVLVPPPPHPGAGTGRAGPGRGGLGSEGGGGGGDGCGIGPLASVPPPFYASWNPLANRFRGLFVNIFGSKYSFVSSISLHQEGGGTVGGFFLQK